MEQIIEATIGLTAIFGMGMWVGYRMGHRDGLATWRKDYRRMTLADIREHKAIIQAEHKAIIQAMSERG